MGTMFHYIKKYGDKTFLEEEFNEVDNLIFSCLSYLDFDEIVPSNRNTISLQEAGHIFMKKHSYSEVKAYGFAQRDAYKVLKAVVDTRRYSSVLAYSYVYLSNDNKQFCAITFRYKKNFIYVSFEGTDHLLSGWKEDFQMAYEFPVPSQAHAIWYLNKTISIFDKNVIVGGHSKGGNLALVSSMYCFPFLRTKIKKIYNNDGPGLREEEILSKQYKKVKDRLVHFIPEVSYVGILLRSDKKTIIASSRKDIMSHAFSSWKVEDKKLVLAKQSSVSESLEKSILLWLEKHDDAKRKKVITSIFRALEKSNVDDIRDFVSVKVALEVVENLKSLDKETKELVHSFLEFNINYLWKNIAKKIDIQGRLDKLDSFVEDKKRKLVGSKKNKKNENF